MKKIFIIALSVGVAAFCVTVVHAATTFQGPPPPCTSPEQPGCNTDGVVWMRDDPASVGAQSGGFNVSKMGILGGGLRVDSGGANITGGLSVTSLDARIYNGDLYFLTSGKAIRVDSVGDSYLSIGNWGAPNKPVNVSILGNLIMEPQGTWNDPRIVSPKICLPDDAPGNCITSWPAGGGGGDITGVNVGWGVSGGGLSGDVTVSVNTADLDPRYVDVTGDTMSNSLTLTSGSVLVNNGALVGTLPNANIGVIRGTATHASEGIGGIFSGSLLGVRGISTGSTLGGQYGVHGIANGTNGNAGYFINQAVGTWALIGSPTQAIDTSGPNNLRGQTWLRDTQIADGGQICFNTGGFNDCRNSWSTGGVGGSGTTNRLAKFTASNTIGDSSLSDDGTSVIIDQTTQNGYPLTVRRSWNWVEGDPAYGISVGTKAAFVVDNNVDNGMNDSNSGKIFSGQHRGVEKLSISNDGTVRIADGGSLCFVGGYCYSKNTPLLPDGCINGYVAKWDGGTGTWYCAVDNNSGGDITSVTANWPLNGGGITGPVSLGLQPCPNYNDMLRMNSTGSWECISYIPGTGDITAVNINSSLYYVSGDGQSGNVSLGVSSSWLNTYWLNKSGDQTMSGKLLIANTSDVSATVSGGLTVGAVAGENISMDGNEIMARNNGVVSTLYLNNDGGTVQIGASANLAFGSQSRQMLNLYGTSYGIGVQSATEYFRTNGGFAWHYGGVHAAAANDPGAGGTNLMYLTSGGELHLVGGTAGYYFRDRSNAARDWTWYANGGYSYLWTTTQANRLRVEAATGNLAISGVLAQSVALSDIRLKKDIYPMRQALEKVTKLNGYNFRWKNPKDHQDYYGYTGGFIAQEIEEVFPYWVHDIEPMGDGDKQSVGGGTVKVLNIPYELDALLVESVKELKTENDLLKARINNLEGRLEALEERLD